MGCGSSKTLDVGTDATKRKGDIQKHWLPDVEALADLKTGINEEEVISEAADAPEKGDTNETKIFTVGDLVHLRGHVGIVKYVGQTELSDGEWIGVAMEHEVEQGNDGCYEGIKYFDCNPKCGVFARASALFPQERLEGLKEKMSQLSMSTIALIQVTVRRCLAEIRRRKLHLHTDIDRTIDSHVLSTPTEETESISRLSHFLTEPIDGQRNKAFAIYRWMTLNIRYHRDGFFGHAQEEGCDAESVLKNRMSYCEGFAALFEQLCKASNIPARTVRGYAKCYAYKPKQKFQEANHSWNVIRVGGKWHICDTMSGAGYFGDDMMFHRSPNTHGFMVSPDVAALDHFPLEEKWLFLEEPFSKEEFENCAVPSGYLNEAGVELNSHKKCSYTIDSDHIEMIFYSERDDILRGVLKNSSGDVASAREMVNVQPCGKNLQRVFVQFPTRGEYFLDIFVLVHGQWKLGVQYLIYATGGVGENRGGYPRFSPDFQSLGFTVESPMENIETMNGRTSVSLRCYKKRFATVAGNLVKLSYEDQEQKEDKMARNLCFAEKHEHGYLLRIHLPERGEFRLDIFAKYFEPRKPQEYLCSYFINSSGGVTPVAGFPLASLRFRLWELELVDHRENIFSEEGRLSVSLKNPRGVVLSGHLKREQEDLSGMCLVNNEDAGISKISVQIPSAGVFTLNIFGRKTSESKAEFLCNYTIRALKGVGENPGFPQLSDQFRTWGLELVDHPENITSQNGRASLRLKTPGSILVEAVLHQGNKDLPKDLCFTEREGIESKVSVHLPTAGFYRLNIFGREGPGAEGKYLCSYTVMAMSGFGEHAGFPRVSEDFRSWGLRLESHKENITVYDGQLTITLINAFEVQLFPRLNDEQGVEQDSSCLTKDKMEEREIIYCKLPKKGNYTFDLFGTNDGSTKVYLCTYQIHY